MNARHLNSNKRGAAATYRKNGSVPAMALPPDVRQRLRPGSRSLHHMSHVLIISLLLATSFQTLAVGQALAPASTMPVPAPVLRVEAIGMTVSDTDRSVDFFSRVLSFEKVFDVEVTGEDFEHLQGLFGIRMRVVRMKLGKEFITLTEYLAPRGRPIPIDSRSNDRWFQHVAIITSDMERAYVWLRRNKVEHASSGPQRLPDWNKNAGGIKAFYFRD